MYLHLKGFIFTQTSFFSLARVNTFHIISFHLHQFNHSSHRVAKYKRRLSDRAGGAAAGDAGVGGGPAHCAVRVPGDDAAAVYLHDAGPAARAGGGGPAHRRLALHSCLPPLPSHPHA